MIHLYFHGGSGNHGCEAIVRATVGLLRKQTILHSSNVKSDLKYRLDEMVDIAEDVGRPLEKCSLEYWIFALYHKLTGSDYLYTQFSHKKFFKSINKKEIYMSIGGDNYCYNGTDVLAHYNECIQRKGAKTVLWGCSVEPEVVKNPVVAKDLSKYDLITARESISYEALKSVNANTVLVADPAFVLESKENPLPQGWNDGDMIGINASPLILKCEDEEHVLNSYRKLIIKILNMTSSSIALIPHVTLSTSDDCQVLKVLYEEFKYTNRIILLADCNCMELKGYISRCRMFIGARTHATIAAYSSCVPTLVLGYSVKSKGIARDIFGTDENYVIPVQNMSSDEILADGFEWLLNNENDIREYLKKNMPEYIKRAYIGATQLEHLIKGE